MFVSFGIKGECMIYFQGDKLRLLTTFNDCRLSAIKCKSQEFSQITGIWARQPLGKPSEQFSHYLWPASSGSRDEPKKLPVLIGRIYLFPPLYTSTWFFAINTEKYSRQTGSLNHAATLEWPFVGRGMMTKRGHREEISPSGVTRWRWGTALACTWDELWLSL